MSFNADTAIILTVPAVLAALIIGILAYTSASRSKTRHMKRDAALIRATIIEYFRRSGVDVSADCTSFDGSGRFTAVVESEPMKRFRLSHIIEMTLREHVRKTCDLELDKIYWRFPIKDADGKAIGSGNAGDEEREPEETSDEYINEGLEHYRHLPKTEVTELPWETFEEVATLGRDKKDS